MPDFLWYQHLLLALIFIWSGFVRSGLGFGGSLFTLPFVLLVYDDPVFFLPMISMHLLFFASLTFYQTHRNQHKTSIPDGHQTTEINWPFVRFSLAVMLLPKLAGVIGLLVLPTNIMNGIIFSLIASYAVTYIVGKPLRSNSRLIDILFLVIGAYISGTSLLGGPLIIAVAMRHIQPTQFRDTVYVLWCALVSVKLGAFIWAGIDLQVLYALALLPFVATGHWMGMRFHDYLLQRETTSFYRVIGWVLLLISGVGFIRILA